jgi:hypothetical protein
VRSSGECLTGIGCGALAGDDPDFLISGVPVVSVGGLPTDRPLPVVAAPADDWGWAYIRILVSEQPPVGTRELGSIGVDWARFAFADADALAAWEHEKPVDGLGDVVFWGLHEDAVAAEFGATRTGTPGDDNYGWLNLPIGEAYQKAVALQERRSGVPDQKFALIFVPTHTTGR